MENAYAKEITKQAVARACAAFGFTRASSECIDVLADVVRHYLRSVAVSTRDEVEASGRVCAGVQDVIKVLNNDPVFETDWKTLSDFGLDEAKGWKQPFSFDIQPFPVENTVDTVDYDIVPDGRHSHEKFIPSHLPPYPPAHTYAKRAAKKRSAETSSVAAATSKRPKVNVVKSALTVLSNIEESADIQ